MDFSFNAARGLGAAITLLAPSLQAATGTISDVQHVVIFMQENRSFDNYFGSLNGVRGFNDGNILIFQNGSNDLYQAQGGTMYCPSTSAPNASVTSATTGPAVTPPGIRANGIGGFQRKAPPP